MLWDWFKKDTQTSSQSSFKLRLVLKCLSEVSWAVNECFKVLIWASCSRLNCQCRIHIFQMLKTHTLTSQNPSAMPVSLLTPRQSQSSAWITAQTQRSQPQPPHTSTKFKLSLLFPGGSQQYYIKPKPPPPHKHQPFLIKLAILYKLFRLILA